MTWTYIWLGIIVLSVIVEATTSEIVSIWFTGGGLISIILSLCGVPWYITLPIFIAVSFILLLCFRKIAIKFLNKKESKTNAEAIIGKEYKLLSPIKLNSPGTIKVNDIVWNAVSENDFDEIEEGTLVKIINIKGNKYIVKKI